MPSPSSSSASSAPSAPPSSVPPPPSLVWASLVLDIAALVAVVLAGKWGIVNSMVVTGLLSTIITGRVVAKSVRGGPWQAGTGSIIGGVLALLMAGYHLRR